MLIGSTFRTVMACTWEPIIGVSVPCPRRSLLVLDGNSGNIAKHCISACKGRRISITLRKQPPPDWAPTAAELAGSSRGDGPEGAKKKRSLSGSAKRRKKMARVQGGSY
jgi:hypothetical protein